MITTLKRKISRLFSRFFFKKRYPYIIAMDAFQGFHCKFQINSPMESYRIEKYGDEKEFTQLILKELRKEDIFFDIGACLGLVTVHAGLICREVYSFEPEYRIRSHLKLNIDLNSLDNVTIIDWAVSDNESTAHFFSEGIEGRSPSLRNDSNRDAILVKCNSIDNAIRDKILPYPNVMKIDIEGAESLALEGMKLLLYSSSAPRTIFIEIHPEFLINYNSTKEEIYQIIQNAGYLIDYSVSRAAQEHCIFRKKDSH